jgi:hypothetical protein
MKTLYVLVAVAAFQMGFAQKTVTLKDFKNVAISGDIEMELIKANENKLVIDSDEDDEINISQEKGSLKLEGEGHVTLYYKGELENLAAGSDAKIHSNDVIKSKSLAIAAASDAEIKLNVDVKKLKINAASDAEVTLTGTATDSDVSLASDAELHAQGLNMINTTIVLSSDAHATINATGNVTATVGSDGELEIHGNPKNVVESKGSDAEIRVIRS